MGDNEESSLIHPSNNFELNNIVISPQNVPKKYGDKEIRKIKEKIINLMKWENEQKVRDALSDQYVRIFNGDTENLKIEDVTVQNIEIDFLEGIHFASLSANKTTLQNIIALYEKNQRDLNIYTFDGSTALHILIKNGDQDGNIEECIEILLSKVDYTITDFSNFPPVHYVIEESNAILLKKFKEQYEKESPKQNFATKWLQVYHDYKKQQKSKSKEKQEKTIKRNKDNKHFLYYFCNDYIEKKVKLMNMANAIGNKEECKEGKLQKEFLIECIKNKDVDSFINNALDQDLTETSENGISYLQLATFKKLKEVVEFLLLNGKDPLKITKFYPVDSINLSIKLKYRDLFACYLQYLSRNLDDDTKEHYKQISKEIWQNIVTKGYSDFAYIFLSSKLFDKIREKFSPSLEIDFNTCNDIIVALLKQKVINLCSKNDNQEFYLSGLNWSGLDRYIKECCVGLPEIDYTDKTHLKRKVKLNYETLFPKKGEYDSEMDVINYIAEEREDLYDHLTSPYLKTFIYFKWHRAKSLFYLSVVLKIAFLILLMVYSKQSNKAWTVVIFTCLLASFIKISYFVHLASKFFLKDLNKLKEVPFFSRQFFKNFFNSVLLFSVCRIIIRNLTAFISLFLDDENRKMWIAISLLLTAVNILYYMDKHPTISNYIRMLSVVSYTYLKFLIVYLCIIIPAGVILNIIFGISFLKTVIMLIGDIDNDGDKLENHGYFSLFYIILFVLFIIIVLMNLLNGLAVSDTQTVRTKAGLQAIIAPINYLNVLETLGRKEDSIGGRLKPFLFEEKSEKEIEVIILKNKCTLRLGNEEISYPKAKEFKKIFSKKQRNVERKGNVKGNAGYKNDCHKKSEEE